MLVKQNHFIDPFINSFDLFKALRFTEVILRCIRRTNIIYFQLKKQYILDIVSLKYVIVKKNKHLVKVIRCTFFPVKIRTSENVRNFQTRGFFKTLTTIVFLTYMLFNFVRFILQ